MKKTNRQVLLSNSTHKTHAKLNNRATQAGIKDQDLLTNGRKRREVEADKAEGLAER